MSQPVVQNNQQQVLEQPQQPQQIVAHQIEIPKQNKDPDERLPAIFVGTEEPNAGVVKQIRSEVRQVGEKLQEVLEVVDAGLNSINEKASDVVHEFVQAGKKVEHAVENVIEHAVQQGKKCNVCHIPWLNIAVAGAIVFVAIKIFRK